MPPRWKPDAAEEKQWSAVTKTVFKAIFAFINLAVAAALFTGANLIWTMRDDVRDLKREVASLRMEMRDNQATLQAEMASVNKRVDANTERVNVNTTRLNDSIKNRWGWQHMAQYATESDRLNATFHAPDVRKSVREMDP